jgi:hypothetical protein
MRGENIMESAIYRTATLRLQASIKLVVLEKPPIKETGEHQKFLNELQSYGYGYWKWLRKRRIREVFVVCDVQNPDVGKIEKVCIWRKTENSLELENGKRFDLKTGRSINISGEPKYIFPVEDRRVREAWEPQSLRQRVEHVLPALRLKDVRAYADVLQPDWHFGLFNRNFAGAADLLSEREAASMATCRDFAKKTVLGHLPNAIQEFRALVEMMERDTK